MLLRDEFLTGIFCGSPEFFLGLLEELSMKHLEKVPFELLEKLPEEFSVKYLEKLTMKLLEEFLRLPEKFPTKLL